MNAQSINIWRNPIYFLAFGFGAGKLPFAPGTWGTLAAIPLYLVIQDIPLSYYFLILLAACIFGIWICHVTEKALGVHDYSGIVWDEICGYFVTMFAAPLGWPWVVMGFIFFRVFDILKPWPVGWIDRKLGGGLGVMVDDLVAGVYAWIVLEAIAWYFLAT